MANVNKENWRSVVEVKYWSSMRRYLATGWLPNNFARHLETCRECQGVVEEELMKKFHLVTALRRDLEAVRDGHPLHERAPII